MFREFTINSRQSKFCFMPLALKPSASGKNRRVCLVSDCAAGLGTVKGMVTHLQADGWQITVLDTSGPDQLNQNIAGVTYQRLVGVYHETNWYPQMQSLTAYTWLRDHPFDLILFHQGFASAFYSCMARHRGLAFAQTPIVIVAAEPHAYHLEKNQKFPEGRNAFESDFMERKSVTLADGLLAVSEEVGQWMKQTGWEFPASAACLISKDEKKAKSWGTWLLKFVNKAKKQKSKKTKPIFISVCIATRNRAEWLRGALKSLEQQTHTHFEVIVVDDGSDDLAVTKLRDELTSSFKAKKWQWITQKNAGPAGARNHAAKMARGDHLLFMDDDNVAYPDELERFAKAAAQGYDIITCILGLHSDSQLAFPPTAQLPDRQGRGARPVGWTPIGGNVLLASFINVLGDTNSLFRRKVFEKLGGFSSGHDVVLEDFEFLTRALIAGYTIDVIPEVLILYRRSQSSRSMGHDIFKGHINSLKPIAALLPPALRPLLLSIRCEWYQRHCQRRDGKL